MLSTRSLFSSSRGRLRWSLLRLRTRSWLVVQTALAAVAAWYLAELLLPDPTPVFAAIAAVIALGTSIGERAQRAVQLTGGVVLGLTIADLLIHLIGTGPLQIGVMLVLAMSAAVLLGGSELLVAEAAVSSLILVSLEQTGSGLSVERPLEALIGGAVALTTHALLFPPNPALLAGRAGQTLFADLGRTLADLGRALEDGDAEAAERALIGARAIDGRVATLDEALAVGRETVRLAPPRRPARLELERYARTRDQIDFAVRNTRVLARHVLRFLRAGRPAPAPLADATQALAAAVWELAASYDGLARTAEVRELALGAAAAAAEVHDREHDLALSEIAGGVRSTAVDLVRAAELVAGELPSDELPTAELLAPSAA
jgi:uncharacterized membrane protein YgaE (UPF0421/DUF939 family)